MRLLSEDRARARVRNAARPELPPAWLVIGADSSMCRTGFPSSATICPERLQGPGTADLQSPIGRHQHRATLLPRLSRRLDDHQLTKPKEPGINRYEPIFFHRGHNARARQSIPQATCRELSFDAGHRSINRAPYPHSGDPSEKLSIGQTPVTRSSRCNLKPRCSIPRCPGSNCGTRSLNLLRQEPRGSADYPDREHIPWVRSRQVLVCGRGAPRTKAVFA